jgi:hypothetical protein
VVVKIRERLEVTKQAAQTFDVERFNRSELSVLEVRKQYQNTISNKSAALENLYDGEDINRAWENIIENINTSAKNSPVLCELKQHKPW